MSPVLVRSHSTRMTSLKQSRIYVIAGVNGAGKSSVAGATINEAGAHYYNPDEAARRVRGANLNLTQPEANSLAWREGVRLLQRAITDRLDFAFETTLGANTIPRLLKQATAQGIEVCVWYVGLDTAERHIARVQQRVWRGGHDIPEADIRRRYGHSRLNLIELLPYLTALRVFDNSIEADPAAGRTPRPRLVLHVEKGEIVGPKNLTRTPGWAKPIVAAVLSARV